MLCSMAFILALQFLDDGEPRLFLTDDSDAERNALKAVFKNSRCLLCAFHVLQSIWRHLIEKNSGLTKPEAVYIVRRMFYQP